MVYVGGGSLGKTLNVKYAVFLLVVILCVHVDDRWFIGARRGRPPVLQPAGADLQLVENTAGITAGILKYNEEYYLRMSLFNNPG